MPEPGCKRPYVPWDASARAKATGDAITFVSSEEEVYFAQIERKLGKRMDRAKTPELPEPSGPPEPAERQRSRPPLHGHAKVGHPPARPPRHAGGGTKTAPRRTGR